MRGAGLASCLAMGLLVVNALLRQSSDGDASEIPVQEESKSMSEPETFLRRCVGKWKGTVRTWFEPGKLADESAITGEIVPLFNGRFFRHTYEGSMQGKPRTGEETLALNQVTKKFQITWIDSFHTPYAILISEGDAIERGFSVHGLYDWQAGQPQGGWRTVYELIDADHLTITAYNIIGDAESKAVETVYERVR